MRILVDGVLLQLVDENAAQAKRCTEILLQFVAVAAAGDVDVIVLDRGGLPDMGVADVIPFPTYRCTESVSDSTLLQRMCDAHAVDVFISTCLTTPLTTPTMQLVMGTLDDLPELNADSATVAREREIALLFSAFVVHAAMGDGQKQGGRGGPTAPPPVGYRSRTPGTPNARTVASFVLDLARKAPTVFAKDRPPEFMAKWLALKKVQAAFEF